MYIEGIVLEHFSALPKADISSTIPAHQLHAVFHYFLSDYRKQDAATNNSHSNRLIALIKDKKLLTSSLSKTWKSTDGCSEQYRRESALYIMSVMSQFYSFIID